MAATDLERLVVQLSADITKYERSLARASGQTNKQFGAIEKRASAMNKNLGAGFNALGTSAVKAFALIGGANGLKNFTDSATKIDNALKVAGQSGSALEGTYNSLYTAAQKNAAPIESLVQLYSRVSLVQGELGVSSAQIVKLTDNVGKALRISGVSAEEASGGLLQLAQALGSNKIQAEEYNSLIDSMPGLLQAAASGIIQAGGSVSKLTQLVKSGKISNKAFFDGIQAGSSVLDDRLAGSVETIDQRFIKLKNSLTNAAREINKSSDAAKLFGEGIDDIKTSIDSLDFAQLIADVGAITAAFAEVQKAATSFFTYLGQQSGVAGFGEGLVNMLGGKDGKASFLGGLLTVSTTNTPEAKALQIDQERLDINQKISDLQTGPLANSAGVKRDIALYQARLNSLPAAAAGAVNQPAFPHTKTPQTVLPQIDITADKYKPLGDDKKGKKSRADEYAREVEQIQKRTASTIAETEAQAKLNPLIDDYGFAVAQASAKQDLLNAAKEAGKKVTPELTAEIDKLATQYANASVAAERLGQAQDLVRQRAEEMRDLQKDVTKGIVQGFIEGKSAAELFSDALSKIGDKLLDMAINGIFDPVSKGGAGFDIFSLFKANGGPVHAATGGRIRGPGTSKSDSIPAMLSDGEYVINAAATKKNAALLEAINSGRAIHLAGGGAAGRAPRIPTLSAANNNSMPAITYAPTYDARGADAAAVSRLEQAMARDRQEFAANVLTTMRKAKSTRNWK
jgi:tape measure domain-containing protein